MFHLSTLLGIWCWGKAVGGAWLVGVTGVGCWVEVWIPAFAGMTDGRREWRGWGMTGGGLAGRCGSCRVTGWVPACAGMTGGGGGIDGVRRRE